MQALPCRHPRALGCMHAQSDEAAFVMGEISLEKVCAGMDGSHEFWRPFRLQMQYLEAC